MKCCKYLILPLLWLSVFPIVSLRAQSLSNDRGSRRGMLSDIKNDIKKNYFDPNFKGFDLEVKFKNADEKIKQATSMGQMNAIIAQFMVDFDDSHLFFIPPGKANRSDYGFDMRMIGGKCYVVSIDEKSDAARKGLAVGDEIYSIDGFAPLRETFWKIDYFYRSLSPRPQVKLDITKPDGTELGIIVNTKIIVGRLTSGGIGDMGQTIRDNDDTYNRAVKQYFYEKTPGLFIWKMPHFSLEPSRVDSIMDKVKDSALVLDLRGNSGGRVDMVLRLLGNFFAEETKVYDEKSRKETKAVFAKLRSKDVFGGKLVVIIDSQSASASEIFSKVIQLEKRGVIIGDTSAGAVIGCARSR